MQDIARFLGRIYLIIIEDYSLFEFNLPISISKKALNCSPVILPSFSTIVYMVWFSRVKI